MIRYAAHFCKSERLEYWMPRARGASGCAIRANGRASYFAAPKRLSNEFVDTIGAEPETRLSLAAGVSTDGFSGGRPAAACLASGFGAVAFGASGRGGSPRLAPAPFGFGGRVLAVGPVSTLMPAFRWCVG